MINFASICPHPPLLLPSVGSENDKLQVEETLKALEKLKGEFEKANPDSAIISSPHPDWGFNVPLHFLAKDLKGEVRTVLTSSEPPEFHFEKGKKLFQSELAKLKTKTALIASGDLSHCLKEESPYGFHSDGPKFDKALIEALKAKDIESLLKLDKMFPGAGECGLRSFCFVLGILEAGNIKWQPEIFSYEAPFGVGYLVLNFKLS